MPALGFASLILYDIQRKRWEAPYSFRISNDFDTMMRKYNLTCLGRCRNLILTKDAKEAWIGVLLHSCWPWTRHRTPLGPWNVLCKTFWRAEAFALHLFLWGVNQRLQHRRTLLVFQNDIWDSHASYRNGCRQALMAWCLKARWRRVSLCFYPYILRDFG